MRIFVLCLCTAIAFGIFHLAQAGKIMKTDYLFGVRWEIDPLPHALDVQGIPQSFSGAARAVDARQSISQFVRNGGNVVSLAAWPPRYEVGQELAVSLLYWKPDENPNTDARTAFRVSIVPTDKPKRPSIAFDSSSNSPLVPITEEIKWEPGDEFDTLTVAFDNLQQMPTWCWETGDVLTDDATTLHSLTAKYRELHTLLAAGSNEKLMDDEWPIAIHENATAYDQPIAYVRQRTGFQSFLNNPDVFELEDFPTEPMKLKLAADNRVAWLVVKGVRTPLRFDHIEEEGIGSSVHVYFTRRSGVWSICR